MSLPIVTITVFRYKPGARFRAFANMGRVLIRPIRAEGLTFSKLMGSGIDFGLIPDFSTYVYLSVWESAQYADGFRQTDTYQQLAPGAEQISTLYLLPLRSHGLWDGKNPFAGTIEPPTANSKRATDVMLTDGSSPIAVLTRATIRPRALRDFWRHVPQARQRLRDHADTLLFGIGVGEVPIVQQCTISVWRDAAAVEQYAYRQSGHREVVRLTRQSDWYREELFARFTVLRGEGPLFSQF